MDILEIQKQRLSAVLDDFTICKSCEIVDRDDNRIVVGYRCPRCGAIGDGARSYFPSSVRTLIDLMQEFYHLKQESDMDSDKGPSISNGGNHQLAVVIFFCTLVEVLLHYFLERRMSKIGLSREIQERLLNDNIFIKQRVQKLFPAITSAKWKETVKMLSRRVELDYVEAVEFYEHAAEKRNLFLHRGNKWIIPKDMPEKCLRQIWPILNLFVSLHNNFVAKPLEKKVA